MQERIPTCLPTFLSRTNKTCGNHHMFFAGLQTTCNRTLIRGVWVRPLGANLLPGALPRWSTATPSTTPQPAMFVFQTPPSLPPSPTARCLYCRPQGRREAPGGGVGFRVTGGQSLFAQVIVAGEERSRQSVASSGALSPARES